MFSKQAMAQNQAPTAMEGANARAIQRWLAQALASREPTKERREPLPTARAVGANKA